MQNTHDAILAAKFSAKRAEAEAHLRRQMEALGLFESDGWRIAESSRTVIGGSEIVLRPLHLHLDAPRDLECIVRIEEESAEIRADCTEEGEGFFSVR